MLDLNELLIVVQRQRIFLRQHGCSHLAWWAPSVQVAPATRRALRQHRAQLVQMIADSDIQVCPARDLHRRSWHYVGSGRFVCDLCRMLDRQIEDYGNIA